MTDRLRRLDALFAERVLGCKVRESDRGLLCGCESHAHVGHDSRFTDTDTIQLAHFTRSLDAVWEATNDGWCCRHVNGDFNYFIEAVVVRHKGHGGHEKFKGQSQDHPAEALVLACLRAVGVSEEDLA